MRGGLLIVAYVKKAFIRRTIRASEFAERYNCIKKYLLSLVGKNACTVEAKYIRVKIDNVELHLRFYQNDLHPQHGRISGCEIYDYEHPSIYKIVQFTNGAHLFPLHVVAEEIIKRIEEWLKKVTELHSESEGKQ